MVAFASGGRKEGREKIPELSVEAALLAGLLSNRPQEWQELLRYGYSPLDIVSSVAELVCISRLSFLIGPRGLMLHRWPTNGVDGEQETKKADAR